MDEDYDSLDGCIGITVGVALGAVLIALAVMGWLVFR